MKFCPALVRWSRTTLCPTVLQVCLAACLLLGTEARPAPRPRPQFPLVPMTGMGLLTAGYLAAAGGSVLGVLLGRVLQQSRPRPVYLQQRYYNYPGSTYYPSHYRRYYDSQTDNI